MIETVRSVAALRARVATWRAEATDGAALPVALVPTMGALHLGHLSLVKAARAAARRVVVSLFVNPAQFGPNEDFARYPRDEASDARAVEMAKADLLYAPGPEDMYPAGFATSVAVPPLAAELEGAVRPHHFAGVATVVTKLLNQAQADAAFFGEKDYQQLLIVRRLAADLDIPTRIVGVSTVRDADGLALSSRNAYLNSEERKAAPALYRVLSEAARAIGAGGPSVAGDVLVEGRESLIRAGFSSVDYLEFRDAETLAANPDLTRPARLLGAARLGKTRLIDNVAVAASR